MMPIIASVLPVKYVCLNIFMEKILLTMDSRDIDTNAIRFACYLTRLTRSRLTAVFLESPLLEKQVVIVQSQGKPVIESVEIAEVPENEEELNIKIENIQLFNDITRTEGIQAQIFQHKEAKAREVIAETRFTDVLVVDAATSFSGTLEDAPTRFVKEILKEAECLVIISPQHFNGIDNIVFCYDGSKSSVFAIKQFTYLFPELKDKRAKIIYMNQELSFLEEDQVLVTGWLQYHYKDVEFLGLDENSTDAFFKYLKEKKNDFVVMGAYGHGLLASFFAKEIDNMQRTTSLPIFVAHC